jgi:NAD(P)-dependent dehydrogenase (short-subunit alcohol dehydrogenase family)
MTRFAGRVAFVSGATSGIGRATALAFAREGAEVVVADIDVDGVRETARLIEQTGGQALALSCDVTPTSGTASSRSTFAVHFSP